MLRVSARFAEAAGHAPEELNGRRFIDLFEPGAGRSDVGQCIAARKPFRDAVVSVPRADSTLAWWSVSGRPAYESRTTGSRSAVP
jgi:hypothetical protein